MIILIDAEKSFDIYPFMIKAMKKRIKELYFGRALWRTPIIPAIWKVDAGGL
jgi:hypothetical protein